MKQAIKNARDNKFKLLVFKEVSRVGRDKQENPAIIGMFEQYGVRVVAIRKKQNPESHEGSDGAFSAKGALYRRGLYTEDVCVQTADSGGERRD